MSTLDLFPSFPQHPAYVQKLIAEHTEHLRHELQVKDQFLKAWHHDIGGPIGNMKAALSLLNNGDESKDVLELLITGCQILTDIHSNIAEFLNGHTDKVNAENIELAKWLPPIVELYRLQATGKNIHIGMDIDNVNGLTIVSDKLKVTRIIANLLGNAIKFTPGGKSIFVRACNKQQQVYIEVQDEGIGIPGDKLIAVFQPYVQLDEKGPGMGIGLSICKDLVEQLQGEINVISVVGEGSTFTVMLPLSPC